MDQGTKRKIEEQSEQRTKKSRSRSKEKEVDQRRPVRRYDLSSPSSSRIISQTSPYGPLVQSNNFVRDAQNFLQGTLVTEPQTVPNIANIFDQQNLTGTANHSCDVKIENASSRVLIILPGPTAQTQIDEELLRMDVVPKNQRLPENSNFLFFEFSHVVEAISFYRKTNGSFLNGRVKFDQYEPECTIEKYLIQSEQQTEEPQAFEKILICCVVFESCSVVSDIFGSVSSPYRISVVSQATNWSITSFVPPLAIMRDQHLGNLAGLRYEGNYVVMNSGVKINRQIHENFLEKFYNMFVKSLKIFGSSNKFDKAVLLFESWEDVTVLFDWLKLTNHLNLLQETISFIGVISPEKQMDFVRTENLIYSHDIEERSHLMDFIIEKQIAEDSKFLTTFLHSSDCRTIKQATGKRQEMGKLQPELPANPENEEYLIVDAPSGPISLTDRSTYQLIFRLDTNIGASGLIGLLQVK